MVIIYQDEPTDPPPPYSESQPADVSRETIIKHTSDKISGPYPLLDLLDLSNSSGAIDVTVKPGCAKTSAIATFNGSTSDGHITARFPTYAAGIPQRDYRTSIESTNGAIRGPYILGSRSSFKSQNGRIQIDLCPASWDCGAELDVHSTNGQHDIRILQTGVEGSLDNVNIRCHSTNGAIKLKVPFEGSIRAQSYNGSITVEGKGVRIEKDIQSRSPKVVEARAGKGNGSIEVSTTNGSIKIIIE